MLALLGLGKAKLIAAAVILSILLTVMGVLYLQNKSLRSDLLISQENNAKLALSLDLQAAAVEAAQNNAKEWQEAHEGLQKRIEELTNAQRLATTETRRLSDIFSKHDLTALSLARPGLIERRIGAGSRDALRVLERITSGDIHNSSGDGATGQAPSSSSP